MSKRFKFSKIFYFGKGIQKADTQRTPIKGVPNTNIDFYEKKTGKFHRRRKLNSKGQAYKDLGRKREKWKKQAEKGDFGNE